MQWGVYQTLGPPASCAATTSFALTGALAGFAVTVQCTDTTGVAGYSENGVTRHVYRITSTGCNPPAAGACPGTQGGYYVERQLEATLDK
jgi:hypothetical protein